MTTVLTTEACAELQKRLDSQRDNRQRAVCYQLYEQLSAISWGRKILLTTVGLLSHLLEHWADNDTEQAQWKHCVLAGLARDRTSCLQNMEASVYLLMVDRVGSGPYVVDKAQPQVAVATQSV